MPESNDSVYFTTALRIFLPIFYLIVAMAHFVVAWRFLPVESIRDVQNYVTLSITFAAVVCIMGSISVFTLQRTFNWVWLFIQISFSAIWLFLLWSLELNEDLFDFRNSLYISYFRRLGFVGQSPEGDELFHAMSALVYYLLAVPMVLLQLFSTNGPVSQLNSRVSQLVRVFGGPQEPSLDLPKMSADARFVVEFLNRSISETKARASWVLRLILLLLIAGVLVIAFAGQITNLDLVAGNDTISLDVERSTLNARSDRLSSLQQELFNRQNARITVLEAVGISAQLDTLSGQVTVPEGVFAEFEASVQGNATIAKVITPLPAFKSFVRDDASALPAVALTLSTEAEESARTETNIRLFMQHIARGLRSDNNLSASYLKKTESYENRQMKIGELIDKEREKRIEVMASPGEQNSSFLIASAITRFGIVAIIVYIVQVLVGLYRYNMRLASFYTSRLKAVVQGQNTDSSIEFFSRFFDTAEITFGKDINGPTQDIKEVIETAIEKAAQAWAKTPIGT